MTKKFAKQRAARLQMAGHNRYSARRYIYGATYKMATQYGRGVQRAITTAEKARREALRGEIDGEAEASGPQGKAWTAR